MGGISGNAIAPSETASGIGRAFGRTIAGLDRGGPMTNPFYDPYTAARRPDYSPFGPSGQFYQPIYQPSYSRFSPFGYGQAPFGGFYQPPQQFQPMMRPMQRNPYSIPYRTMGQVEAAQAAAAPPAPSFDGGFKKGGQVDDGIASLLKR